MKVQQWDTENREYHEMTIPSDWHVPLMTDLDDMVNCVSCGELLPFGDCYTSHEYQTKHGMGYGVCSACYEIENDCLRS